MADENNKRFRADVVQNPFLTYNKAYNNLPQNASDVFSASPVAGAQDIQRRTEISNQLPVAVTLPPHLFIPGDAQSVDLRNLANVAPASINLLLMSYRAPKGGITKFIGYGVFFDALMFDLINLVPTVNGSRIFPFHGNPDRNFKIGLGTGADLSNQNLIPCQLDLQPNDLLEWRFTNNDVVDVAAGVRMSGYFDQSTIRKTGRFGG